MAPDRSSADLAGRATGSAAVAAPISLQTARVVIADDDKVIRMLLDAALRKIGVGEVTAVDDGMECLALLDTMEPPDLLVLDVMMPRLDGIETCRRIRGATRWRDVPIVIHTMLSAPHDRVRCFEAGATDVVGKPVYLPELCARLQVHLASRLMTRSLERFRNRIAGEFRMAERVQRALLPDPRKLAAAMAPLRLSADAAYFPCDEIGGDLWDMRILDDRRVAVSMVDLAGHGLVAAMNAFRVRGMIGALDEAASTSGAWLAGLNDAMCGAFSAEVLATALHGIIDLAADCFTYASAGSPPPILGIRDASGGLDTRLLNSAGLMLGVVPGIDYPERSVAFAPGSFLFLFSDGAIADTGPHDSVLPALAEMVRAIGAEALPAPLEAVGAWLAPDDAKPRSDDITMVWIGRDRGC